MNLHRNAVRGILLSACVAGSASAKIGMGEAFAAFSYLAAGASACAEKVGAAHAFHSLVSHVPSKEMVSYALWHGGKELSQLGLDNKGKIVLALATYYGKDRALALHEEAQTYLNSDLDKKTVKIEFKEIETHQSREFLSLKQKMLNREIVTQDALNSVASSEAADNSATIKNFETKLNNGVLEASAGIADILVSHEKFLQEKNEPSKKSAQKLANFFGTGETSFKRGHTTSQVKEENQKRATVNMHSYEIDAQGNVVLENKLSKEDVFSKHTQRLAYAEQKFVESRLVNNRFVRGLSSRNFSEYMPKRGK